MPSGRPTRSTPERHRSSGSWATAKPPRATSASKGRASMKTALTTLLVCLAAAGSAGAAQNSASTQLLGPPTSGDTLNVKFTVFGTTPVVPYEYALENTCAYPKGHFTLGQHDDIVTWTDQDSNGNPQVTMPVYLQSVPAGASCRVTLVRNN